ncbi:PREDICTED: MANSC domain-containing protein 1 [Apaloderma vittatum]|uniref:MANSC domain-containing protein 1 n=1 Tax=Apaloderma vittatum TaxID=57397 RepID=UPI0005212611|nr:PREDICTED: MANSC domain-containing protein 1 [Apaloderma vittatum]
MAGPCLTQECSAEKMENAIIDINLSLPKGIRGAEPRYASTAEACIRACCSAEKLSGDKKCNLVIFDARRTSTHPNCYLFYCPSTEACPMKPATGLVSYKITRDTHAPEDTSFNSEDFSSNEYSLSSDAGAFISHSQTSHQNRTTALQSNFHEASELQSHMEHLDNAEFHTVFPESQQAKHPESLEPISRQKVINLPPNRSPAVQIANPSAFFSTIQSSVPEPGSTTLIPLPTSTTQLESHTTSLHPSGAKPATVTTTTTATFPPAATTRAKPGVPAASIAVTRVPLSSPKASASTSTAKQMTVNSALSGMRTLSISPEPTVVFSNYTSRVTLLSLSGFTLSTIDSPRASQNDPQGYNLSDAQSYLPKSFLRGKDVVQLGEKSSLVAALLFGVIFLLLVIALMWKKVQESLQKRHYTRLDYLINGMYSDV